MVAMMLKYMDDLLTYHPLTLEAGQIRAQQNCSHIGSGINWKAVRRWLDDLAGAGWNVDWIGGHKVWGGQGVGGDEVVWK